MVVRPTARVNYRGVEYSVPACTIGQTVTLHLQQEQVAIYLAQEHLATHPRFPDNRKSSILHEHAEELFQSKRGKPYIQRQLLWDLAPIVEPYLTELVHRLPLAWADDIEATYELYKRIGRRDLLAAIELAIESRCFGSEYLIEIVEHTNSSSMPEPVQSF